MAGVDFGFNIALGRQVEIYNRIESNLDANSALIAVILAEAGIEADGTLRDYDDLAALLAGASNEVTNTNYARKTFTDADLAALPAPDDTNNRRELAVPDLIWTPGPAAGDSWGKLLWCWDTDTTAGTDSAIVPVTAHALPPLVPDGSVMTLSDPASGFFRAQG